MPKMISCCTTACAGCIPTRSWGVSWGTCLCSPRYLPYVGYVTLVMNDFPMVKYVVLALLGLSMLLERE